MKRTVCILLTVTPVVCNGRMRKRNIRSFWDNPLVNLCYTLSVLAFVAGVFGILALIGRANTLLFSILMFIAGVLLLFLGKKLNARRNHKNEKNETPNL